jgi:hypothetical protein
MKSLFSQQFDTIEKDPAEDNFSRSEALDIWRQLKSSDSPTIKPRNALKASKTFDSKKKMSVQPENNFNLIPTAIGGQDDDFLFDTEEQEMTQKLDAYDQEQKPQNHSIISLTQLLDGRTPNRSPSLSRGLQVGTHLATDSKPPAAKRESNH